MGVLRVMSQENYGLGGPAVMDSWVADLATAISLTVMKAGQFGWISNNVDEFRPVRGRLSARMTKGDPASRSNLDWELSAQTHSGQIDLAAAVRASAPTSIRKLSQANLTGP
ncbi:hypothetical protein ACMYSQ_000511 [Aspergillus niger]